MTEPTVTQTRTTFSIACQARTNVRASAARIWGLLTDARDFPRWNSTVASIEGEIRDGGTITIRVPGTSRIFRPRVSDVVPNQRMTWIGGFRPVFKGVRTFELEPRADGSTTFTLAERFSGLMIPLVRRSMPDFGPVFARFVDDLKREAELPTSPTH